MQKVEEVAAGDTHGVDSALRYVWQGIALPDGARRARHPLWATLAGIAIGVLSGAALGHLRLPTECIHVAAGVVPISFGTAQTTIRQIVSLALSDVGYRATSPCA
jgi:uncharacterized membrane protein